ANLEGQYSLGSGKSRLLVRGVPRLLLSCVLIDQGEQSVGQVFACDFVVHRMQLLVQPEVERTLSWRSHFHACLLLLSLALVRLIVIRHGALTAEQGLPRGFLYEAYRSPRENAHIPFTRA